METRLSLRRDAVVASLLALLLGVAWTWQGRGDLAALRLPDTDDMMRLQQVRDWLGGQGWRDLVQHRLGAGVPMHWTRLADLGPAGLIVLLRLLVGAHAAEVAAVVAWPLVLFAVAILLVARIARAVDGGRDPSLPATAAIVAAVAYPATTVFAPGRIDHHGLQMVLLLGGVLALVRRPSEGAGFAIGLLAAAGLVVGLETAPLVAAIGACAVAEWVWTGARERLTGIGIGALTGLAIGRGLFAPAAWSLPVCDGFTALAWQAALPIAALPLVLASLPPLDLRRRGAAAAGLAAAAAGIAVWLSPACLHPYGAVGPALTALWLSHVGEALPWFGAPPALAIGYGGVMAAGLAATGWRLRLAPTREWTILTVLLLAAAVVTLVQLRGAYAGALLAAPGLAAAIGRARARGAVPVVGAWAASAGMIYPLAADALPRSAVLAPAGDDCISPALVATLARLPQGRVMAPVDAGAALIAATPQTLVAGPYHRDGAGILASFAAYRGSPARAEAALRDWRVGYLVACSAMPGRTVAGSAAHRLASGPLDGWHPLARFADGARIDVPDARLR